MNLFAKLLVSAILIAPVGLTGTASAFTTYNNSADFIAAAGAITTVDFAGCSTSASFNGDESLGSSGACSGLPGGVDFTPTTGGQLYVAPVNWAANPTLALGLRAPIGGIISFTLSSLATSFGGEFFENLKGGATADATLVSLLFYNDDAQLQSLAFDVNLNSGTFIGATGLSPFNRVSITQAGGYPVIDNISFNGLATVVTAAPEPATWAMMLLGFGAAGFAMRRAPRRANETAKA